MFQETWKTSSDLRESEGIIFLEHGLTTKVCPCGSQGVTIALGPEARQAWERACSLCITPCPRILATRLTIIDQHKRPVSLFLVSAYAPDNSEPPEERGNNPQFKDKKLLTAQRPRTYAHPTRPIKLLGPPHAYPQPAPTGQAPVVYAARCLHVSPGSSS